MAEFRMPSLGADMDSGTLIAWHMAVGDHVARGDIVAEVDTDKSVIDVETFTTGTVEKILVAEGARVPVGTPLAVISEDAVVGAQVPAHTTPGAVRRPAASPLARRHAAALGVELASVVGTGPDG
ncbi:MAG TPA: biotin/lipoyl-containing protein, partial [Cellulomonas sp.]